MGRETRECDFDAETRRRRDRRGEATRKRERARRQRRNVAFGSARSGFRREDQNRDGWKERDSSAGAGRGGPILPGGPFGGASPHGPRSPRTGRGRAKARRQPGLAAPRGPAMTTV